MKANNINFLKQAEKEHIPIALYGAGKYGRNALKNIQREYPNINIHCFIDDDLVRNNEDVEGIQVVQLREVPEDCRIVISNYYVTDTLKRLQGGSIELGRVFFTNDILVEPVTYEYIMCNENKLSDVYDILDDYESKMIYRALVEARLTHNIDY